MAVKVGNQGVSPLYHAALRSAGAALLVWGWSAWRGIPLCRRDGTAVYGTTIATLFAIEFVCIYWGFMFTTVARGILFVYAAPFFVALGAHWLFPTERLHQLQAGRAGGGFRRPGARAGRRAAAADLP